MTVTVLCVDHNWKLHCTISGFSCFMILLAMDAPCLLLYNLNMVYDLLWPFSSIEIDHASDMVRGVKLLLRKLFVEVPGFYTDSLFHMFVIAHVYNGPVVNEVKLLHSHGDKIRPLIKLLTTSVRDQDMIDTALIELRHKTYCVTQTWNINAYWVWSHSCAITA